MPDNVRRWLEGLGLEDCADAFLENKVDMSVLPDLTVEDLKDMGITAVGDRRKLLAAISKLETIGDVVPQAPEESLDGSRRQVAVLFADISGFTALTSSLDAEETHALLNGFFAAADADAVRGRIFADERG